MTRTAEKFISSFRTVCGFFTMRTFRLIVVIKGLWYILLRNLLTIGRMWIWRRYLFIHQQVKFFWRWTWLVCVHVAEILYIFYVCFNIFFCGMQAWISWFWCVQIFNINFFILYINYFIFILCFNIIRCHKFWSIHNIFILDYWNLFFQCFLWVYIIFNFCIIFFVIIFL